MYELLSYAICYVKSDFFYHKISFLNLRIIYFKKGTAKEKERKYLSNRCLYVDFVPIKYVRNHFVEGEQ